LLLDHLLDHYALYGDYTGVRTARKHIGWYVRALPGAEAFRARMNLIEDCEAQWQAVGEFFDVLGASMDRMPVAAVLAEEVTPLRHADNKREGHLA